MALFWRSDNSPMMFHFIGELSENEKNEMTQLIQENGGTVSMTGGCSHDVKFMKASQYERDKHPECGWLYDIKFVKDCVEMGKILDLTLYRLNSKTQVERCVISVFENGVCRSKEMDRVNQSNSIVSNSASSDDTANGLLDLKPDIHHLQPQNREASLSVNTLSNGTDSFHTAIEFLPIKSELPDSQGWHSPTNTAEWQDGFQSMNNVVIPNNWPSMETVRADNDNEMSTISSIDAVNTIEENCSSMENLRRVNDNRSSTTISSIDVVNVTPENCSSMENLRGVNDNRSSTTTSSIDVVNLTKKKRSPKETVRGSNDNRSPTKSTENHSGWIATDDTWMQNERLNNGVHPVTEFVEVENNRLPLLRCKPACEMRNLSEWDQPGTSGVRPKRQIENTHSDSESADSTPTQSKTKRIPTHAQKNERYKNILSSSEEDDEVNRSSSNRKKNPGRVVKNVMQRANHAQRNGRAKTTAAISDEDDEVNGSSYSQKKNPGWVVKNVKEERASPVEENGRDKTTDATSDTDDEVDRSSYIRKKNPGRVVRNVKEERATNVQRNGDANTTAVLADQSKNHRGNNSSSFPKAKREEDLVEWGVPASRQKQAMLEYGRNWRRKLKEEQKDVKLTRMSFTQEERDCMVSFLCSHPNIEFLQPKGLKIWQQLVHRTLPHRTAQSLQNHFVKYLLPTISDYFDNMSPEHRKQFEALRTSRK